MLDIQTFNHALKAKWVQKYLDDNNRGKWKLFFDYFLAQHNAKLLMTGKECETFWLWILEKLYSDDSVWE